MKAAVLGATGYAGATLARLLAEHPDVRTLVLASGSRAGAPVAEAVPELSPRGLRAVDGGTLASVDEAAAAGVDVVFAALPHLSSAQTLEPFLGRTVGGGPVGRLPHRRPRAVRRRLRSAAGASGPAP